MGWVIASIHERRETRDAHLSGDPLADLEAGVDARVFREPVSNEGDVVQLHG